MQQYQKVEDAWLTPAQMQQLACGFEPGDQVYQSETYGLFNAGLYGRIKERRPDHFKFLTLPLDEELVKYIVGQVQINPKVIESMSLERAAEPVFAVSLDDPQPVFIIDGHHRIVKRAQLGLKDIHLWLCTLQVTNIVNVVKGPL